MNNSVHKNYQNIVIFIIFFIIFYIFCHYLHNLVIKRTLIYKYGAFSGFPGLRFRSNRCSRLPRLLRTLPIRAIFYKKNALKPSGNRAYKFLIIFLQLFSSFYKKFFRPFYKNPFLIFYNHKG